MAAEIAWSPLVVGRRPSTTADRGISGILSLAVLPKHTQSILKNSLTIVHDKTHDLGPCQRKGIGGPELTEGPFLWVSAVQALPSFLSDADSCLASKKMGYRQAKMAYPDQALAFAQLREEPFMQLLPGPMPKWTTGESIKKTDISDSESAKFEQFAEIFSKAA